MFATALVDPPWLFNTYSLKGKGRSPEQHYPVMTLTALQELPVASVMLPDSVLLLWATWPLLPQALALGAGWGFTYKTAGFVWAKTNKRNWASWFTGLGYWTRANTEMCLLFTRGHPRRKGRNVRQLVVSPVTRHSEKPPLHARIEALISGPYLELFARRPVEGWTCLGNEIDGQDISSALEGLCLLKNS